MVSLKSLFGKKDKKKTKDDSPKEKTQDVFKKKETEEDEASKSFRHAHEGAIIFSQGENVSLPEFKTPSSRLKHRATYKINSPNNSGGAVQGQDKKKHPFSLVFSRGSVVDFNYPSNPTDSAIVNAANKSCFSGGGVDGAIAEAGGPNLFRDRYQLPLVRTKKWINGKLGEEDEDEEEVRCPTGDAKVTGPNHYGSLHVPYVIHAVGPNYLQFSSCLEVGDDLLRSAYTSSLIRAKERKLEAVAFCLLSAGIFRGKRTLEQVLKIAIEAISDFDGYDELREVHICAFTSKECETLEGIAEELNLLDEKNASKQSEEKSQPNPEEEKNKSNSNEDENTSNLKQDKTESNLSEEKSKSNLPDEESEVASKTEF